MGQQETVVVRPMSSTPTMPPLSGPISSRSRRGSRIQRLRSKVAGLGTAALTAAGEGVQKVRQAKSNRGLNPDTIVIRRAYIPEDAPSSSKPSTTPRSSSNLSAKTLHSAVKQNAISQVRELVAGEIDVNSLHKGKGPLHAASKAGLSDMVTALLELGANPDLPDKRGLTALHTALQWGQLGAANLLVPKTTLSSTDDQNLTPLHYAAQHGRKEIMQAMLCQLGDQAREVLDMQTNDGDVVLHYLVAGHHTEMITWALTMGASVTIQNEGRLTPQEMLTEAVKRNERVAAEAKQHAGQLGYLNTLVTQQYGSSPSSTPDMQPSKAPAVSVPALQIPTTPSKAVSIDNPATPTEKHIRQGSPVRSNSPIGLAHENAEGRMAPASVLDRVQGVLGQLEETITTPMQRPPKKQPQPIEEPPEWLETLPPPLPPGEPPQEVEQVATLQPIPEQGVSPEEGGPPIVASSQPTAVVQPPPQQPLADEGFDWGQVISMTEFDAEPQQPPQARPPKGAPPGLSQATNRCQDPGVVLVDKDDFVGIKKLIENDQELNRERGEKRITLLHAAVARQATLLKELSQLQQGEVTRQRTLDQRLKNNRAIIYCLAHSGRTDVTAQDVDGRTPLHWAGQLGVPWAVSSLVRDEHSLGIRDRNGQTPLHVAVEQDREEVVLVLLEHGADVNRLNFKGWSAFHCVVHGGLTHYYDPFLSKGAQANPTEARLGDVILVEKVKVGSLVSVRALLIAGAIPGTGAFSAARGKRQMEELLSKPPMAKGRRGKKERRTRSTRLGRVSKLLRKRSPRSRRQSTSQSPVNQRPPLLSKPQPPPKPVHLPPRRASAPPPKSRNPSPPPGFSSRPEASLSEERYSVYSDELDVRPEFSPEERGQEKQAPVLIQDVMLALMEKEPIELLLQRMEGSLDQPINTKQATLLHIAVSGKSDAKTIEALLRAGASHSVTDAKGHTPLHKAVKRCGELLSCPNERKTALQILVLLLSRPSPPVNVTDKEGRTPLHLATASRDEKVATVLRQKGAHDDVQPVIATRQQPTLVVSPPRAVRQAKRERVVLLADVLLAMTQKKDINGLLPDVEGGLDQTFGKEKLTLLHQAGRTAGKAARGAVEALLRAGANPDCKTSEGRTPLLEAIARNRLSVVKLLVSHRASVVISDADGSSPLHYAVNACSHWKAKKNNQRRETALKILDFLLKQPACPLDQVDTESCTALVWAVKKGDAEVVGRLMAVGADKSIEDTEGNTPLQIAAGAGDWACVTALSASAQSDG